MCSRKKQNAPSSNATSVNLPLICVQYTESAGKRKADSISDSRAESNAKHSATEIVKTLEAKMQIRLIKKIAACLTDSGSLSNLKKGRLTLERIERDAVSDTEIKAGFKLSTITNYIKHSSKANIGYWRDYAKSQFDTIAERS